MRPTGESLAEVLDRARGPRRAEADELVTLCSQVSGEVPVVWASRIVGFGRTNYRYATGHGGVMPLLAFAPSATRHKIYLTSGFEVRWPEVIARLGPYRSGTSCLYLTRLASIDREALRDLLERTLAHTREEWPPG